jgi:N-acyl-D-amino-acid deacylase
MPGLMRSPFVPIFFCLLLTGLANPVMRSLAWAEDAAADGESENEQDEPPLLDLLLTGGRVLDGAGNAWVDRDIGIAGETIVFVGNADLHGVSAKDKIDVTGLLVVPGFWDMHSHGNPGSEHGRRAEVKLYQGITTIVTGVDGGGRNDVAEVFESYERQGIAVNVAKYVGHNAARRAVMGNDDREPTPEEMEQMKEYVRHGLEGGAIGLSTGLFYVPGTYASTDEVVALNKVNAEYGGVYDTHDRDLGAAYQSVGYESSVREAIEIGERAGTPVIFSHFNLQGAQNYGRAPDAVRLVEEARACGVNVMAAQHPYNATRSSLAAYTIPAWARAGGHRAMVRRFDDPEAVARLDVQTAEMLQIRGGPEKIFFVSGREELDQRTLAAVADEWGVTAPQAVRRILRGGNASVMNLELYDNWNTRLLARQDWMMTCTDGGLPRPGEPTHPRSYGAFTRKLRRFVLDEEEITLPFAVRGMTSLAATFLGFERRGLIKEGFIADIAVLDLETLEDRATYDDPHQHSRGTVHVIVNGQLAFRNGSPTGVLAGQPLRRRGWQPHAEAPGR